MRPFTVWLASYPKSGNTWARSVLHALTRSAGDGTVDINALGGGPIACCRWSLDARLGFASSDLTADEIDALRPACDAALDAESDDVVFRKIHDGLFSGPGGTPIVSPAATRAAIYLVRDPRDVAVSAAHFTAETQDRTVARMADPDNALCAGDRPLTHHVRQRLGTWSGHVDGWTGHDLFPVAVLRYEDLCADPVGGFARLAAFAGLTVRRDQVAAAVAAARFDLLRAQEASSGFRERPPTAPVFFRRGIVGAWRDELSTALVHRIEADHGATMARLGYPRAPAYDGPAARVRQAGPCSRAARSTAAATSSPDQPSAGRSS